MAQSGGVTSAIFRDGQTVLRLQVTFATEPVFHGGLEFIEGHAVTGFEKAVGDGEGVVEDGVVSKVAHSEAVDPFQRTGMSAACGVDAFDAEFADKHRKAAKQWLAKVRLAEAVSEKRV